MAVSDYFVDPAAGDDATGDGSLSTPWQTTQHAMDTITRNSTDGDRINIKAGTDDVLTADLTLTGYGTMTAKAPLIFEGYTSAQGDGGIGAIDGDASWDILGSGSQNGLQCKNMKFHNVATNKMFGSTSGSQWFYNCEFTSSTKTTNWISAYDPRFFRCQFTDFKGFCPDGEYLECYFQPNLASTAEAVKCGSKALIYRCIFSVQGSQTAIKQSGYQGFAKIYFNTILSSAGTGSGFEMATGSTSYVGNELVGNYFEGFSGAGGKGIEIRNNNEHKFWVVGNNYFYNNATHKDTYGSAVQLTDDTSLAASGLDKSGADSWANRYSYFAPTSALQGKSDWFNSVMDIGAIQTAAGGGGGGAIVPQGIQPLELGVTA